MYEALNITGIRVKTAAPQLPVAVGGSTIRQRATMSRDLNDRQVVDAFVAHRAATDHRGISVDSRPDESERNESAIDAVAGPLAIEHTSIDTIDGQRRDSARLMDIVSELESELGPTMGFRLSVVFPYDGIRTGQDWGAMKRSLKDWLLGEAPSPVDGWSPVNVLGLPFAVDVEKAGPGSGRQPGLFFARSVPPESDLIARLRRLIERKAAKLRSHRAFGKTTVLVVESDDIALMNRSKLLNAVSDGFPEGLPEAIDELWYADTSVPRFPPRFSRIDPRSP
jgi:hypothetical protein